MDKWPTRQERLPADIVNEMREIAAGAAVATDAEYEVAKGSHHQFGNNFFLLFLSLKRNDPKDALTRAYLRRAESLGDNWKRFRQENSELIDQITSALDQVQLYSNLLGKFTDLYFGRHFDEADKMRDELKVEHVGIAAWNKLNPLLEQVAEKMKEYDIDPNKFFE